MTWSKLRAKYREFICPELAKRLDLHLTSYSHNRQNTDLPQPTRGWITLDGKEIINFKGFELSDLDRQDLYLAIKTYPSLSIEQALASDSVIIRGLAMVDRRLGKKRLAAMQLTDVHDFVKTMFAIRLGEKK